MVLVITDVFVGVLLLIIILGGLLFVFLTVVLLINLFRISFIPIIFLGMLMQGLCAAGTAVNNLRLGKIHNFQMNPPADEILWTWTA